MPDPEFTSKFGQIVDYWLTAAPDNHGQAPQADISPGP